MTCQVERIEEELEKKLREKDKASKKLQGKVEQLERELRMQRDLD